MGTIASQITSLTIVYSRSKKTPKLRLTGLCAGNSPGTGEFPAQMASYAENISIWWRHHGHDIHENIYLQAWFTILCWCGHMVSIAPSLEEEHLMMGKPLQIICSTSVFMEPLEMYDIFQHTIRCRYNAVNCFTGIHKRHPKASPLGRGVGCLWLIFPLSPCNHICNILLYWTVL